MKTKQSPLKRPISTCVVANRAILKALVAVSLQSACGFTAMHSSTSHTRTTRRCSSRTSRELPYRIADQQFNVFSSTYRHTCLLRDEASQAAIHLTVARKRERAAMRDLAKVCAKVREGQSHVPNADVIDVPMRLTYEHMEGESQ
jgi:hypothetical protein